MSKKALFLRIFLVFIALAAILNLGFLDWRLWREKKEPQAENISVRVLPTPTPLVFPVVEESSPSGQKLILQESEENCSQACLLAIDKAVNTTQASSVTPSPSASSGKIVYLPLGSGSIKSQDWIDVPGLVSYIDPGNYGKIKTVIFEASLRIPTANGRIYVRLYNKNDGRPVWFSEISSESAASTLIQSSPITFDGGNKLYQVQAKTTMGFESFIDFARLKFITE